MSADSLYSNGFVVDHNHFLVTTDDELAIALTKLLRFRYQHVYILDAHGVEDSDLLTLDISTAVMMMTLCLPNHYWSHTAFVRSSIQVQSVGFAHSFIRTRLKIARRPFAALPSEAKNTLL